MNCFIIMAVTNLKLEIFISKQKTFDFGRNFANAAAEAPE